MIELTEEQADFLKKEFNLSFPSKKRMALEQEELRRLHELCSDIEEEESILCQNDDILSERGDMAVKLSDIFYNELEE